MKVAATLTWPRGGAVGLPDLMLRLPGSPQLFILPSCTAEGRHENTLNGVQTRHSRRRQEPPDATSRWQRSPGFGTSRRPQELDASAKRTIILNNLRSVTPRHHLVAWKNLMLLIT